MYNSTSNATDADPSKIFMDKCIDYANGNTTDNTTQTKLDEAYALASWRWPVYQMGIIIPVLYSITEMGLNKLLLRFRHGFIVFGVTILYMAINGLGTIMYANVPVYRNLVVWSPD
jgi:hypothetical protein